MLVLIALSFISSLFIGISGSNSNIHLFHYRWVQFEFQLLKMKLDDKKEGCWRRIDPVRWNFFRKSEQRGDTSSQACSVWAAGYSYRSLLFLSPKCSISNAFMLSFWWWHQNIYCNQNKMRAEWNIWEKWPVFFGIE